MTDMNIVQEEKEFNVNGKAVIRFNPSDSKFATSFISAFESLLNRHEAFCNAAKKNPEEFFTIAEKADADMREIINGLFGEDICTPIFDKMSMTAISEGLPLWLNFMLAIMDEITAELEEAKKKKMSINPKLKKYLSKFDKK
nr:MAG TPA: hypothetical protein [Caudoviricetes sp.]DAI22004.1 MAG TPA: hypothetical protein [Caudoviricetes sp.]